MHQPTAPRARKKNPKKYLADRALKALPPAKPGTRYEIWDTVLPGFGVRVSDAPDKWRPGKAGRIMFVLYARFPSSPCPSRRALGLYGALSLAQAREKASEWLALIRKGVDPAVVEEQARQAALRQQALARERSFAAVAEAFIADKLPSERKGREVERDLRNVFLPAWGSKAIDEITDLDVLVIINAKKRSAPAQARNLLGTAGRLFDWAIDQRVYGLNTSPCDRLKPKAIIGEKIARQRRLNDDDFFAFLRAARRLRYPYGPVYQLLALTGLRLNEVAGARWSEIRNGVLTVPAARMKGREAQARDHAVPLPPAAIAIIDKLPRFQRGNFLLLDIRGREAGLHFQQNQNRARRAHAADIAGDGPDARQRSRCGRAGALGQSRSAAQRAIWAVGAEDRSPRRRGHSRPQAARHCRCLRRAFFL